MTDQEICNCCEKTLSQAWDHIEKTILHPDMKEESRRDMQKLFYAGALFALHPEKLLRHAIKEGKEDLKARALIAFRDRGNEVIRFFEIFTVLREEMEG